MDPYSFDMDIRIGEKWIRIRLWIRIWPKIEENSNFFSLIKNMILKTMIFLLLFVIFLFIYINKKVIYFNNFF